MELLFRFVTVLWLGSFVGLMIGRAVYLQMDWGVNVLTLARGKRGLAWLAEVAFVPFLLGWLAEVLLHGTGSPARLLPAVLEMRLLDVLILKVLGSIFLAGSLGLFLWALLSFGRSWRVGIDECHPGELVTSGAFAVSRNPIFVCLNLAFLGVFFLYPTAGFLLAAIVMVLGAHFQILQEERFLSQQHGRSFVEYCKRTSRYFGRRKAVQGALEA